MCFHLSNTKTKKQNEKRFDASFVAPEEYEQYFHFAGYENKNMWIIKQNEYDEIHPASWGLLPEYLNPNKRNEFLRKYKTYNATSERIISGSGIASKFIMEQRCLILIDGFFEPHYAGGKSIPHYIKYKDHSLFAFGGVYTQLENDTYTTTIITREANEFFSSIHNKKKKGTFRMPLVLERETEVDWLSDDLFEGDVNELLNSFTKNEFEAYPVSKNIEKGNVNYPEILSKVEYSELNNRLF